MFYTIKVCKEKSAYEVVPNQDLNLNLMDMAVKLCESGYTALSETPVVLLVKKECKVHIYPSGKLIIDCEDIQEVNKIAEEIYKLGGQDD